MRKKSFVRYFNKLRDFEKACRSWAGNLEGSRKNEEILRQVPGNSAELRDFWEVAEILHVIPRNSATMPQDTKRLKLL